MKDRPDGVTDAHLRTALADGWGIEARELSYLPVGAGSYHWAADGRWFVTVDDRGFAETFEPLERAFETARALRRKLDFVVAPIDGPRVLWPIGDSHAVSVFPLLDGEAGGFGGHGDERESVIDLVAALHQVAPPPPAEITDLRLPGRDSLLAALDDDHPWASGPYAASAQELLATHAGKVRSWLADYDRMADELRGTADDWVVTHGEPHPANVLRTGGRLLLIDWDTVRVAPPERDLWHLARDPFAPQVQDLTRYTEITGRAPSPTGLAFYRLSWILADITGYAADLRRPHTEGGDAKDALENLTVAIILT